jgi:hypothetical protein
MKKLFKGFDLYIHSDVTLEQARNCVRFALHNHDLVKFPNGVSGTVISDLLLHLLNRETCAVSQLSCHSCDYSHPHDKIEFTEVGGVYLNSQLPEEEVTVSQGLGLNTQWCQAKIALVALKSLKYDI